MKHISRAFTLIELLVVISIIALLIAILLPALAKARSAAQATQCASNARQIGLATEVYAEESQGVYPHNHTNNWGGPKWWQQPMVGKYLNGTDVYFCPSDITLNWTDNFHEGSTKPGAKYIKISYAFNTGYRRHGLYRVRDSMTRPSDTVQIGDRPQTGYWAYQLDNFTEWSKQFPNFFMHDDMTFNVAHFDNHVSRVKGAVDNTAQNAPALQWGSDEWRRIWDRDMRYSKALIVKAPWE